MSLNKKESKQTSDILESVVREKDTDLVTIGELVEALHERGFGVLMALAALPLCIPAPAPPGYTLVFSVPLFIFAGQLILGSDKPWLPKWIIRRTIKRQFLATVIEKAAPWLRKVEAILRPRLEFAATRTGERVIGFFAFVFAISIALPIPIPLTNLLPGIGVLVMALGLLSRDGLVILSGMAVGMVGIIVLVVAIYAGSEAAFALVRWMGDLFN